MTLSEARKQYKSDPTEANYELLAQAEAARRAAWVPSSRAECLRVLNPRIDDLTLQHIDETEGVARRLNALLLEASPPRMRDWDSIRAEVREIVEEHPWLKAI